MGISQQTILLFQAYVHQNPSCVSIASMELLATQVFFVLSHLHPILVNTALVFTEI
jgi:hypothetical protein